MQIYVISLISWEEGIIKTADCDYDTFPPSVDLYVGILAPCVLSDYCEQAAPPCSPYEVFCASSGGIS